MNAFRVALIALVCSAPLAAAAQWQWIDAAGRKVFSDQAPPPDVPPSRILRQPGQRGPAAVQPEAAPAEAPAAALPSAAGVDKTLEERRKQADAAAAAKQKAEEEKVAALRAENCASARKHKETLDSGIRLARVNDKGEREVMDDAARAAEMKKVEAVIARDCAK